MTIVAMYFLKPYIAARAQLVTFILFSLTVYYIKMFLETNRKRYCIPLLIIPILIANLHCAVFPFYFVLFLPYIVEYLLILIIDINLDYDIFLAYFMLRRKLAQKIEIKEKYSKKVDKVKKVIKEKQENREKRRKNPYKIIVSKNSAVKWLILVVIITAFTGFLNPAGNGAYTYTYKIYQGNTANSINEHLPPNLLNSTEFLFSLCAFLAILIFTDTKIKLSDLFMLIGLVTLALMSRRQISMFYIFCIPILVKLISAMFEKYDKKLCERLFKFSTTTLGALIICVSFSIYAMHEIKEMKKSNTTYINESSYPVEAATWMLENLDLSTIKLYNEYNYGSYLLFRGIPVFIDSRCDLYTPEFNGNKENEGKDIFSDTLNIDSISVDYNNKFDEYDITHIISYSNSKLVMLMKKDSKYKKIYEDDSFAIFERLNQNI